MNFDILSEKMNIKLPKRLLLNIDFEAPEYEGGRETKFTYQDVLTVQDFFIFQSYYDFKPYMERIITAAAGDKKIKAGHYIIKAVIDKI
jgi:hypothetical protein